ncbi:hypothetical protein EDC01DRAFT_63050 [Geopyxis carbonaria]|nr:hypothetical protein EDC01DRAFT_63050 [Geopyxis carbonaria]
MQFPIVLATSLLLSASVASAADMIFYASTGCTGASVSCGSFTGTVCCTDPGQVYASVKLTGSSGSITGFSNEGCAGVATGQVGTGTCLSASFAIQSARATGANRLAAGAAVQSILINKASYTTTDGVARSVRIPAGREMEVSKAVRTGDLALLDTLADF